MMTIFILMILNDLMTVLGNMMTVGVVEIVVAVVGVMGGGRIMMILW